MALPVQPWDVIDTWGLEQQIGFHLGNILKYAMRFGNKDAPLQEARKLAHYAQKLVEVLETEQGTVAPWPESAWKESEKKLPKKGFV